jgi:hypothetical protein
MTATGRDTSPKFRARALSHHQVHHTCGATTPQGSASELAEPERCPHMSGFVPPENELLVWLIRTSAAAERGPSAEHPRNRAACRPAIHSLPMSAVDGDRPGGNERHVPDPTRRPAGQGAKLPAIPASEQRDDEVPEASTVNGAAVAAYRLSVQAGNPLSERRLAHMFGRTSRRWARARIADVRQASSIQESPGTPGHGLTGAGPRCPPW